MQNSQLSERQRSVRARLYGMVITALMAITVCMVQVAHADTSVACGDVAGLIAAINTANSAGGDVITLAAGCTYLLNTPDNSGANGSNGLPVITSTITINGNGSTIARVPTFAFRILEVATGGNLTFNNLTITNGKADGSDNAGNGGGIFVNPGGLLTVSSVTENASAVLANTAVNDGGGIYIAQGGLIAVNLATANSSVAAQNTAGHDGGGLYVAQNASLALQSLALNSSVAIANHAGHDGGGIYIAQGGVQSTNLAILNGSVARQNSADHDGGGIYITQGGALSFQFATLNASVAIQNSASNDGGGLYIAAGGILSLQSTALNFSAVNGNQAGHDGGGLYLAANSTLTLQAVTLNSSMVSGNEAGHDGGGIYITQSGLVTIDLVTSGTIATQNSMVTQNIAGNDGGGIYIAQNAVAALQNITLNDSLAKSNQASHDGGGIYIAERGTLSLQSVTLNGSVATQNIAGNDGGGLYVAPGSAFNFQSVTLNGSAVNGNRSDRDGGGLYITAGGSIGFQGVTLNSSVVNANQSGRDGGGIYLANGGLVSIQSISLNADVVKGNQAGRDGGGFYIAAGGGLSFGTLNLVALSASVANGNKATQNGGGFYIANGGTLSFQFLIFNSSVATKNSAGNDGGGLYIAQGGNLNFQAGTLNGSVANANQATHDGGGIYIGQGSILSFQGITFNNSPINANDAGHDGGGLYIADGGLLSFQGVTLNSSTVNANRAANNGGGIYIAQSSTFTLQAVTLNSSTVNANRAGNNGGGIFNAGGTVSLANGPVNGNQAGVNGGGIFNLGGMVSLTNNNVNGNQADYDGGGILNVGIVANGAVVTVGNLFLTNTKVKSNKAGHADANIANSTGGSLTINNSQVDGLPPFVTNFSPTNERGYGDSRLSYAWSTAWFKGKLYVGVNKSSLCSEVALLDRSLPGSYSTSPVQGVTCAPTPQDLDLRGEIWAYTPEIKQWALVYRSPEIDLGPSFPGKKVALDVGYRGMAVYPESDGTEALYVGGVTSGDFNCVPQPPPAGCLPFVPPPRILRSTNGTAFTPLPQAPGTFLGDLPYVSFRSMAVYTPPGAPRPRLYTIAGTSLGDGVVVESQNPAGGNDNFHAIGGIPTSCITATTAYELAVFNGFLYIGAGGYDLDLNIDTGGYAVLRTNAIGPPYTFTTIVDCGAGRGDEVMFAVSMHVFKGKLYVGANGWSPPNVPIVSELIRINPDDTWELVVGNPRPINHKGIPCPTNGSIMCPTSGMPDGFGNIFNAHFWRMQEHNGILYLGTNDSSVHFQGTILDPYIKDELGADLWASQDGNKWVRLNRNGFGNPYNFGIRTFASSLKYGLFVGTANQVTGVEVWLGY